ncbi:MAG: CHAT domain-containing protein [Myxococcota bacterium]
MKQNARWLLLTLALLSSIIACRWFSAPPTPIDVEWTGCTAERQGPICELGGPATLTLWTKAAVDGKTCAPPTVRIDGKARTATISHVDHGFRVKISVAPTDRKIEVRTCPRTHWALSLRPRTVHPSIEALRKLANQDPRQALARFEKRDAFPEAAQGFAWWIQARLVAMLDGIDDAQPVFASAIHRLERDGHLSDACAARAALSHFMVEAMRFEEAETALQDDGRCAASSPSIRAYWPYYRAIVAIETYQIREALERLGQAARRQARLDQQGQLQVTRQQYGRVWALLGRFDAAQKTLQNARNGPDECYRAYATNELAWAALLAEQAQQPFLTPTKTIALLREGLEEAETCGASDEIETNLLSNLVFALISAKDIEGANRTLARARAKVRADHARVTPWWLEAKGHLERLRGQHREAHDTFNALWEYGERILDEAVQLRASVELGHLARRQRDVSAALLAYERAEAHLESMLSVAPLGRGRSTFIDARTAGTTARIELLIESGRIDEAALVARRSLRRGLRTVAQATQLSGLGDAEKAKWRQLVGRYRVEREALSRPDAWRLSQAELGALTSALKQARAKLIAGMDALAFPQADRRKSTPLPPATLRLILHPKTDGTWLLFAQSSDRTKSTFVAGLEPTMSPQQHSARLLAPIADQIRRAETIVIVAPSALNKLDLHALPFDGRPLLATRTVLYSMDLDRPLTPPPGVQGGLVTFDQSGRLAAAEREARSVAKTLGARIIEGPKTLGRLTEALPAGEHFHFAGHGLALGVDGFDSGLMLDDSTAFTSLDVLSLSQVPPTIVLSGCEMAKAAPSRYGLTLGLGQAFVLRGAHRVVAPVRQVKDETAARFSALLYEALLTAPSFDHAVVSAQRKLSASDDDADWRAFRILSP